jgi:phage major head subunit gpT-like protein
MVSEREAQVAFIALNGLFGKLFTQRQVPPWASIATRVDSATFEEYYPFIGSAPLLQLWEQDDRVISDLDVEQTSIVNQSFETTIKVPKTYIEDMRLNSMNVSVASLANAANLWPVAGIQQVIANATTLTGYDGAPLISATHKEPSLKTTQSNILTGSGLDPNSIATDISSAVVAMATVKDNNNNPVYGLVPDTVILPPNGQIFKSFRTLAHGAYIVEDGQIATGGDWSEYIKHIFVHPLLSGDTWYAVCTTAPINSVIWQVRREPTTGFENDWKKPYMLFGVDARGAFAPGNWRCIFQVTNS